MPHAFKRPAGPDEGISFLIFTLDVDPAAEAARVAALNPTWEYLGEHPVPATRRFRNCWDHDGNSVTVNITKAKAQRLSEVRAERDALLLASDGLAVRALELGTEKEKKDISDYRQALRDLPAAQPVVGETAEALEAWAPVWPVSPL